MPYDPRMLAQMAQMGVGMMGPEQRNAFADPRSQHQKQWWEPAVQVGRPANRPVNTPDDRSDDQRKQPPSLLQMLMLGGQPTYSGTPRPAPPGSNPWAWLGSMGGGGRP